MAAYACLLGGWPERAVAIAVVVAVIATVLNGLTRPHIFDRREVGLFLIDSTLTIAVLWIALVAERYWPLWVAAILIFDLILQLAIWYAWTPYRSIYLVLVTASAYPTLALIALGTRRHQRRKILSADNEGRSLGDPEI